MIIDGIDLNKVSAEKTRKRLVELSKSKEDTRIFYVDGSICDVNNKLIAERPNEEQKQWFENRMKGSSRSWQRWYVGQYFTEQQKKKLGLTDEDIGGKR